MASLFQKIISAFTEREATDSDIAQAVECVGRFPAKISNWLKEKKLKSSERRISEVVDKLEKRGAEDQDIIQVAECTDVETWPQSIMDKLTEMGFHVTPERVAVVLKQTYGHMKSASVRKFVKRKNDQFDDEYHSCESSFSGSEDDKPKRKKARMDGPDEALDVQLSIEKIRKGLEQSPQETLLHGKRQLVIVGVTGSGKSTLTNSLAGCEFRQLSEVEADQLGVSRDSVRVHEGGNKAQVSTIGFDPNQSCTTTFQSVDLGSKGLMIWDVPGFEDSSGCEVDIANAINLSKLLKVSIQHGLVIIAVLDAGSLEVAKGAHIRKTIETLTRWFGCEGEEMHSENLHGVLFCVTKACPQKIGLETARRRIITAAVQEAGLDLTQFRNNIVFYDPLFQNPEAVNRNDLLDMVSKLRPVSPAKHGLFSPISRKHEELIRRIAEKTASLIESELMIENQKAPDFEEIQRNLSLFDSLSTLIDRPAITLQKQFTRSCIKDALISWQLKVKSLIRQTEPNQKQILKFYLQECIQGALVIQHLIDDLDISFVYDDLCQSLIQEESSEQSNWLAEIQAGFDESLKIQVNGLDRFLCCDNQLTRHYKENLPIFLERNDNEISDVTQFTAKSLLVTVHSKEDAQHILRTLKKLGLEGAVEMIEVLHRTEECKKASNTEQFIFGQQVDFFEERQLLELRFLTCFLHKILNSVTKSLVNEIQKEALAFFHRQQWGAESRGFISFASSTHSIHLPMDVSCLSTLEIPCTEKLNRLVESIERFKCVEENQFLEAVKGMMLNIFAAAVKHMEQIKRSAREQQLSKFRDIVACPELGDFETRKLQLCDCLDNLRRIDSVEYTSAMDSLLKRLDGFQNAGDIATLIQAKSWAVLIMRYELLKSLEEALKDHGQIDTSKFRAVVYKEIERMITLVVNEIRSDEIGHHEYMRFDELRNFRSIFEKLVSVFPWLCDEKKKLQVLAIKTLKTMIQQTRMLLDRLGSEHMRAEDQDTIAKLLIKSCGVALEIELSDDFKDIISKNLLSSLKDSDKLTIGDLLLEKINCTSAAPGVSETAQTIINMFPDFKTFNIEIFNKKAGGVSFEEALSLLQSSPSPLSEVERNKLRETYLACHSVYSEQINSIALDIGTFDEQKIKRRIDDLADLLLPHSENLSTKSREFGEFLGLICAQWTFLSTKNGSLQSICKSKRQLRVQQPHATQILGILCLAAVNQSGLANHLIQINTGEGKSIALGFTAAVFAKLGFRVDVVCYNSYLSKRDRDAFSDLFASLCIESVNYSDFDELCSRLMATGVHSLLPNVRKDFHYFLTKGDMNATEPSSEVPETKLEGKSLLLLDEVDVFFSEDFYGRPHCPAVCIDDGEGYAILKQVWENRGKLGNQRDMISKLMLLPETRSLRAKYPNLSDTMLEQEFTKMFECISRFPKGRTPQLTGGEKRYVIDQKQKCIGYENPVSGVPSFTASYSYLTAFTYFHCCESGQLSEDSIRQNIRMQPVCGSILYSYIPHCYDVCMGMTGTLDCLTNAQCMLLKKNGFLRHDLLPSTFSKNILNQTQPADAIETVVVRGSKDEYFQAILTDLDRELHLGRAVLIVFADYINLSWFQSEIKKRFPRHPQYRPPLELTDRLSLEERQSVITRSMRSYTITLMTRSYGRGTDFVCRDEGLRKNGGVHIILTFFPEHESEQKQIFGRTCRQDDPGSGRKILFEDDLAHLGATERAFKASGVDNWDVYLTKLRTDLESKTYNKMMDANAVLRDKHTKTLDACSAARSGQWEVADLHFLELNRNVAIRQQGSSHYHVVFVLDNSDSMEGDRWRKVQEAVQAFLHMRINANEPASDLISIISFGSTARIICERVSSHDCLSRLNELLSSSSQGSTNYADALVKARQVLRPQADSEASGWCSVLLFMSDGEPDAAGMEKSEMLALAEDHAQAHLIIYTIAFGCGIATLEELAHIGGGTFVEAVDGVELCQSFENVAATLSHTK